MRVSCLLRPGQGGGADGGRGGPIGPAAPGQSALLGSARPLGRPGGVAHVPCPARRPPGGGALRVRPARWPAFRRAPAAAAAWEPPLRVHTSPHRQGNGSREPRCPPGVAGPGRKPRARPPLAWDSPGPRPRCPRAGCDFTRVPSEEGKLADWRRPLATGLSTATRKPAAAPLAAAQTDLNTPARAGRDPRAGCAQGALVSDPSEGNWGISSA